MCLIQLNVFKSISLVQFFFLIKKYPSSWVIFSHQCVFSFLLATITIYHKFSSLMNINVLSYTSEGQKFDMGLTRLNQRFGGAKVLSVGSGQDLFPCLFQFLEATCIP